jgi:hypothetical protein
MSLNHFFFNQKKNIVNKMRYIFFSVSMVFLAMVRPSSCYLPMMMMSQKNPPPKHFLQQYWEEGVHNHKKHCGIFVVKVVSSFLPHIEKMGHRVLSINNDFVHKIMNCKETQLSHPMKGKIILMVIGIAQWGDNLGSQLLKLYHDIIKSSFEEE